MAKISTLLFLLFIHGVFGQVETTATNESCSNLVIQPTKIQKSIENCVSVKFHYLELDHYGWETATLKHLEIFLDEKEFSEENLRNLFKYLSKKYPEIKTLVIVVHTNWAQLEFPSDCPPIGVSNQPAKSDKYEYHQATYYRNSEIEYFRYNPILKTEDFKIVVLKGKKMESEV